MAVKTQLHTTLIGDDEPIESIPAELISYSFRHNAPGSVDFKLAVDWANDKPWFSEATGWEPVVAKNRHELVITRNKMIVWRGPILTDDEDNQFVQFGGEGLLAYTRRWHVTSNLGVQAATDQHTYLKTLFDHHQGKAGGDFGVDTSQVTASGRTREGLVWPAYRRKNIWEAIVEATNWDQSSDIHIDPATRELQLFFPRRGRRRPEIVLDDRNIRSFKRAGDGTGQASQMLGVGAGDKEDTLLRSRQDAQAVAAYRLTNAVISDGDISVAATLQDRVDDELAHTRSPEDVVTIQTGGEDPNPIGVTEDDEIRVVWRESKYKPINGFYRVLGRKFTWNAGEETVSWTLEAVGG